MAPSSFDMEPDDRINLLARVARGVAPAGHQGGDRECSVLALAAASYGSRPSDDSTVPTGFDPSAAALFEGIVEGAYLAATADGVFDAEERAAFERVVTVACGGAVLHRDVAELIDELAARLAADGLETRIACLVEGVRRREHALEILRIAALMAQVSDDVSDVERSVLGKIADALGLEPGATDRALSDVKAALAQAPA